MCSLIERPGECRSLLRARVFESQVAVTFDSLPEMQHDHGQLYGTYKRDMPHSNYVSYLL